jgi:hypothetical protein
VRSFREDLCGHTSKDEGDRYETPSVEGPAVEGWKFPRMREQLVKASPINRELTVGSHRGKCRCSLR